MSAHPCRMFPMSTVYKKFLESFWVCYATSADADQIAHMLRLIRIYTGCKCHKICFPVSALIYILVSFT